MRDYAAALWGSWKPSTTIEAFDPANHHLIECNDAVAGCIAEVWHPDRLLISRLYIDAPFQRKGIGASILAMRSRQAAARGVPIKLSVLTTNPADAFYRRQGFKVEAETAERRKMAKSAEACARLR